MRYSPSRGDLTPKISASFSRRNLYGGVPTDDLLAPKTVKTVMPDSLKRLGPNAPLKIEAETVRNDVRITLSGRLDVNSSPDFRKVAQALCADSHCKHLNIDFADVAYIDTSGLATLLEILVMTEGRGTQLTLSRLNEKVQYLIDVNGLKGFFRIESSEHEEMHR